MLRISKILNTNRRRNLFFLGFDSLFWAVLSAGFRSDDYPSGWNGIFLAALVMTLAMIVMELIGATKRYQGVMAITLLTRCIRPIIVIFYSNQHGITKWCEFIICLDIFNYVIIHNYPFHGNEKKNNSSNTPPPKYETEIDNEPFDSK